MKPTTFTLEFEDGEKKSVSANYIKPQFVRGWWSYDAEGKDIYEYGEEKVSIPLGKTVYFHVETRGILAGNEITLQLYDLDEWYWQGVVPVDVADKDTSKFPNDPVIETAEVKAVDGKSIATLEVLLNDEWEPVIADDHNEPFSYDQTIELYWEVSYKGRKKLLPEDKSDYLRVGYNDRDLYIKPISAQTGLPEFYDKKGKLLIFLFKQANNVSKVYNPIPVIQHFIVSRITITEVHSLSAINNVKRQLFYENVDLSTNTVNNKFGYVTEEASDFIIKGEKSFVDVNQFTIKKAKKFSDYFNRRDLPQIRDKVLREGRKVLKLLDFINMTKTVLSIFPNEGVNLEMPKPASVVSAMGLVQAISKIPGFMALSPLFMAADVLSTKVVHEMINELKETAQEAFEQQKLRGLNNAMAYVQNSVGADLIELDYIPDVTQEAYEKLLKNEFNTFSELEGFEPTLNDDSKGNSYTLFYYKKTEGERTKYLIDSVFLQ